MDIVEIFLVPACLYAAFYDFLFYKIPNKLVLMIIGVFLLKSLVLILLGSGFEILVAPSIAFTATLLLGFVLFAFGALGAGDAKLLAACALWMADVNPYQFIMLVTVSGGILAVTYVFFKNPLAFIRNLMLSKIVAKYGEATIVHKNENVVPYAIAILSGVVWVLLNNR